MGNAIYSKKYKDYMQKIDYLFDSQYEKGDEEEILLNDDKHKAIITTYFDDSLSVFDGHISVSKVEIYNQDLKRVAEIRCTSNDVSILDIVKHSDGNSYLFYRMNLYGYSIMDMSNYFIYDYIPMESFIDEEETFIWCKIFYCSQNNMIAIDGCYWAHPYSTEIFDMSNPIKLPYKKIVDSYQLEEKLSVDNDVLPIEWAEDGTLILDCYEDEEGERKVKKNLDITKYISKKNK